MNFFRNFVFTALGFTSTLVLAFPSLSSRNFPKTCEFVFEVESEIHIKNFETPVLEFSYLNEYEKKWTDWVAITPEEDFSFKWSLVSFSQNPKYLFRAIQFREAGSKVVYRSVFGRQLGEPCQPKNNAPFREREVISTN